MSRVCQLCQRCKGTEQHDKQLALFRKLVAAYQISVESILSLDLIFCVNHAVPPDNFHDAIVWFTTNVALISTYDTQIETRPYYLVSTFSSENVYHYWCNLQPLVR